MLKITDTRTGDVFAYDWLDDFMQDMVTKEMVCEWLDEIYGTVEVLGRNIEMSKVIYSLINSERGALQRINGGDLLWDDLEQDFINAESEYVRDELETFKRCDWYDWTIEGQEGEE